MIVYHGSNSRFNTLRISDSLIVNDSTRDNEGKGIYFSLDKEVALSYGKYIYTISIPDSVVRNYNTKKDCDRLFLTLKQYLYKRYKGLNLENYVFRPDIVNSIYYGNIGIEGFPKRIAAILDNHYEFYRDFSSNMTKYEDILHTLNSDIIMGRALKSCRQAYLFPYNIKKVGVIKDASIAHIVKREIIR